MLQALLFACDTAFYAKCWSMHASCSARRNKSVGQTTSLSADTLPYSSANIQQLTRVAHSKERAEDYVETIADLIQQFGEARATDIARVLGVTHVTVIRTIQRLKRAGLVDTRPYRSIFLTESGRKLAEKTKARHQKVVAFLLALGVTPATARADAEGIEHHVSEETLAAFERFLQSGVSKKMHR